MWFVQRNKLPKLALKKDMSKFQVKIAVLTAKEIMPSLARHGLKDGLLLVIHPATGTLIIGSYHRLKVKRTLRSVPYIPALRSNFRLPSV